MPLCLLLICSSLNAQQIKVISPDKNIVSTFKIDGQESLSYTVQFNGNTVLNDSPIGIVVDKLDLGNNVQIGKAKTRTVNEAYPIMGVHSEAINRYNESIIPIINSKTKTSWILEVRAFDDAVAYRYRVPGKGERLISGESSAWNLIHGSTIWYQNTRNKDYEAPFLVANPDTLKQGFQFMSTATFKLGESRGYAKITEANLINYSDMALKVAAPSSFGAFFHNSPDGWKNQGEIVSPWRVLILTKDLNGLVNTDVLHNLCPPPSKELAHATWIKPGKSNWHWMVTGAPKLEEQKQWVDWTRQLNFDYYIVDEYWDKWSSDGKDNWTCLKEVVDYATSQNVKIFAWVNSNEVFTKAQRDEYFAKAIKAGLVGLKIDFMKPADPLWANWYNETLADAAKFKLMINFHGANKPTGLERTWPNEISREAIRGREMGKQSPLHDTSLPFTRFVQGHADYTPTDFRPEKLKGSTKSHELAMSVVFTSPLFCFSGSPESYMASGALEFLQSLPAVWDETIVLPGSEIGDIAAFARRKGSDWYIGVINSKPGDFNIDLKFLSSGSYKMDQFADIDGQTEAWTISSSEVSSQTKFRVHLNKDGGFVARIKR